MASPSTVDLYKTLPGAKVKAVLSFPYTFDKTISEYRCDQLYSQLSRFKPHRSLRSCRNLCSARPRSKSSPGKPGQTEQNAQRKGRAQSQASGAAGKETQRHFQAQRWQGSLEIRREPGKVRFVQLQPFNTLNLNADLPCSCLCITSGWDTCLNCSALVDSQSRTAHQRQRTCRRRARCTQNCSKLTFMALS